MTSPPGISGLEGRLQDAVTQSWQVRRAQAGRQGQVSGVRDAGERSAVTGGAQMNGLRDLLLARAPARLRRAPRLRTRQHGGPSIPMLARASLGPRRIRFPGAARPAEFRALFAPVLPQAKRRSPRELRDLLREYGAPPESIHCEKSVELPGWFRPEKRWDLIVVSNGTFLAGIEFKSHYGPSFGNNYNNRTEEALGSATDIWAAYREGAFRPSARPWLGYLMLLEEAPGSVRAVQTKAPHFGVFPEFKDSSYARRYELLLTKMVRERLYDAACLILTSADPEVRYREPSPELTFGGLVASLLARTAMMPPGRGAGPP